MFDASSEDGSPGQELGAVAAVTTNIPSAGIAGFVNIDISALNLHVAAGDVYIGVRFAGLPAGVWMGWDESPETPRSVAYLRTPTIPWQLAESVVAPNLRSLMVRPVESGCVEASDVPWLMLTPAGGTTLAGTDDTLIATLDPAALDDGLYRANVCIASNDPRRRKYSVPVAFEVGEVRPAAMVAPERLDLGVITGERTFDTIALTNLGTPGSVLDYTLAEAAETCSAPSEVSWLKLTPASGSVGIGGVGSVLVEADAAELDRGEYRADICLSTNDPDRPLIVVAVALSVAPTNLIFQDNFDPPLPVELAVDDGAPENHVNATSCSFIWMNRFTPTTAELPLTLDRVAVYWSDQGIEVGQEFEIYIYTDSDGNLANGAVLRQQILGIRVEKINAFQSIDLAPLTIEAKDGDVSIALVNRTGMTTTTAFPAAIDENAPVGRSWIGIYLSGDVPVPPILPADAYFGTVEEVSGGSMSGNWLIRGFGTTPSGRPVELD